MLTLRRSRKPWLLFETTLDPLCASSPVYCRFFTGTQGPEGNKVNSPASAPLSTEQEKVAQADKEKTEKEKDDKQKTEKEKRDSPAMKKVEPPKPPTTSGPHAQRPYVPQGPPQVQGVRLSSHFGRLPDSLQPFPWHLINEQQCVCIFQLRNALILSQHSSSSGYAITPTSYDPADALVGMFPPPQPILCDRSLFPRQVKR